MNTTFTALLIVATLVLTPIASLAGEPVFDSTITERSKYSKPFWIGQTVFVSGQTLFVVGIGSHAPSLEVSRSKSLESAKTELKGIADKYRITDAQQALTKEVYDERESDGTFTTYRLLELPIHDYGLLLVDPAQAQTVADILARMEAEKAKQAESSNQAKARGDRARARAKALGLHNDADVLWLIEDERACERQYSPKGWDTWEESCERLQKADLLAARTRIELEQQTKREQTAKIARLCPPEEAPFWMFWLTEFDKERWTVKQQDTCKKEKGL